MGMQMQYYRLAFFANKASQAPSVVTELNAESKIESLCGPKRASNTETIFLVTDRNKIISTGKLVQAGTHR